MIQWPSLQATLMNVKDTNIKTSLAMVLYVQYILVTYSKIQCIVSGSLRTKSIARTVTVYNAH